MTPIGSGERFASIIMYNVTAHQYIVDHNITIYAKGFSNDYTLWSTEIPTWSTDWLAFVSPLLQNILIFILIWKFSKWTNPKNITKKSISKITAWQMGVEYGK